MVDFMICVMPGLKSLRSSIMRGILLGRSGRVLVGSGRVLVGFCWALVGRWLVVGCDGFW
jgi:hypothetical protein